MFQIANMGEINEEMCRGFLTALAQTLAEFIGKAEGARKATAEPKIEEAPAKAARKSRSICKEG